MAEPEIVAALAETLEAFRQGEVELEACLERHAVHRADLEELLEVVRLIPRLAGGIGPGDRFRERTRRMLLDYTGGGVVGPDGWGWQHPSFP